MAFFTKLEHQLMTLCAVITNNLDSVDNAAKNICAGVSTWTYVLISLKYIQTVKLLDHMAILGLTFKKLSGCFPNKLHHFTSPLVILESSGSFISLAALATTCLFHYNHSSGREGLAHCGFDSYFPSD